jgi:phosphodiesterase/alkaline phosphatase D-like protein
MRFTTGGPGAAPATSTGAATATTNTTATLNGTVDAHAIATVFTFAYGTSPSNLNTITAVDNADTAANGPQAVALPVTGLAPGTTYYYRLIATNALGTSLASIRQFTTASAT